MPHAWLADAEAATCCPFSALALVVGPYDADLNVPIQFRRVVPCRAWEQHDHLDEIAWSPDSSGALEQALLTLRGATRPSVQVSLDGSLRYEHVVELLDVLRASGFAGAALLDRDTVGD